MLFRDFVLGPFSEPGDSGSAVVDGKGRLAGLITSGTGIVEVYSTSVGFLLQRMLKHGFHANIFPSLNT